LNSEICIPSNLLRFRNLYKPIRIVKILVIIHESLRIAIYIVNIYFTHQLSKQVNPPSIISKYSSNLINTFSVAQTKKSHFHKNSKSQQQNNPQFQKSTNHFKLFKHIVNRSQMYRKCIVHKWLQGEGSRGD